MRVKATFRDPSLPHQIVLLTGARAGRIDVSCNCLQLTSKGGHKSMGSIRDGDLESAWEIYDQVSHHNNHDRPTFVSGQRTPKEWIEIW